MVRAVVVNHDGGALLRRCVASLLALHWPEDRLDIVISDNASTDASLDPLRAQPRARIIENHANLGFGAAINRALDAPGSPVDAVLLLNPDAWIEPDALEHLAAALVEHPEVGAACPRILFDRPMTSVRICTQPAMKARLVGVRVDGDDQMGAVHGLRGALRRPMRHERAVWDLEPDAHLQLPHGRTIELDMELRRAGVVEVATGEATQTIRAGRGRCPITIDAPGEPFTAIQNDGSDVAADGTGRNRHFHRRLDQADDPNPVFAWCGAAVLLRGRALARVGHFAEPFFLYYEDTDLAWRFQAGGWSPIVVPHAVVWHRHSASTGQGRTVTEVFQHRNRVLLMLRNAPLGPAVRSLMGLGVTAASVTVRALIGRPGARPGDFTLAAHRWRALIGALRLAPWALWGRRALRRSTTRHRRDVYAQRPG